MKTETLKKLLDTCFTAKRIIETLPELPNGMKPRHIHVLDTIEEIYNNQGMCRVSDVSAKLNITTPSVTKLINELEGYSLVKKFSDNTDKRVTLLSLTDAGSACVERHVHKFHSNWANELHDISDEQAEEAIRIIAKLRHTMPGIEEEKSK